MKPKVRYLLQCYMNNAESPENEQVWPLFPPHEGERSGILESHYADGVLPDDILRYVQPSPIQSRIFQNADLGPAARQQIRMTAENLKIISRQIELRRPQSLLSVERAILMNEGLSQEEMSVVNRIHAAGFHSSISGVADCLGYCLTSRTFRAALRFLCYSATSVSQELALACELSSLVIPRIRQLNRSNSIYNAINDFIENRLEAVHDL